MQLTGFRMMGAAYRGSFRYAGYVQLTTDKGETLYFPEEFSLQDAINSARNDGHDVSIVERRVNNWVKTGIYQD